MFSARNSRAAPFSPIRPCRKRVTFHARVFVRVFLATLARLTLSFSRMLTYILAIPAFLTAELTAFTAVCMLFNSCVRSPVAVGTLRCSASTNLVSVMQSESMMFFDVIVVVFFRAAGEKQTWENETVPTETELDDFEALRYIRDPEQRLNRRRVIATVKARHWYSSFRARSSELLVQVATILQYARIVTRALIKSIK